MNENHKAELAAFMSTDAFKAAKNETLERGRSPVDPECSADMFGMRLAVDRGIALAFEILEQLTKPEGQRPRPVTPIRITNKPKQKTE